MLPADPQPIDTAQEKPPARKNAYDRIKENGKPFFIFLILGTALPYVGNFLYQIFASLFLRSYYDYAQIVAFDFFGYSWLSFLASLVGDFLFGLVPVILLLLGFLLKNKILTIIGAAAHCASAFVALCTTVINCIQVMQYSYLSPSIILSYFPSLFGCLVGIVAAASVLLMILMLEKKETVTPKLCMIVHLCSLGVPVCRALYFFIYSTIALFEGANLVIYINTLLSGLLPLLGVFSVIAFVLLSRTVLKKVKADDGESADATEAQPQTEEAAVEAL